MGQETDKCPAPTNQIVRFMLGWAIRESEPRHAIKEGSKVVNLDWVLLSYLSLLPISVLRSLDTEINTFYDRTNRLYDAALLARC